jgi:phosphate:Na+ symporter
MFTSMLLNPAMQAGSSAAAIGNPALMGLGLIDPATQQAPAERSVQTPPWAVEQKVFTQDLRPPLAQEITTPKMIPGAGVLTPSALAARGLGSVAIERENNPELEHALQVFLTHPDVVHFQDTIAQIDHLSPAEMQQRLRGINFDRIIQAASPCLNHVKSYAGSFVGIGSRAIDSLISSAKNFTSVAKASVGGKNAVPAACLLTLGLMVGLTGCGDAAFIAESPKLQAITEALANPETAATINKALLFTLLGGLGIFLLGMHGLTDNMHALLGKNITKLINWAAKIPGLGVLMGAGVTGVIQTSSGTSAVTVGMVDNQTLDLEGAIPILKGANIGTTVTPWLPKLPFAKWGLPLLGASTLTGTVLQGRVKSQTFLTALKAAAALGMLFYGLELMSSGFKNDIVKDFLGVFLQTLNADSLGGVAACVGLGALVTSVVQSSSLVIMVVIPLAMAGLISWDVAYALILGLNLGTTVTAQLAAVGKSSNAKRAAHFHTLFNGVGTLPVMLLFSFYVAQFTGLMDSIGLDAPVQADFDSLELYQNACEEHVKTMLALFHTFFNIHNVLMFAPTSVYAMVTGKQDPVIRLLKWLVKDDKTKENSIHEILRRKTITPEAGLAAEVNVGLARLAMVRMIEALTLNTEHMREIWTDFKNEDMKSETALLDTEDVLNKGQDAILEFLGNLEIPAHEDDYVTRQLESAGDKIKKILEAIKGLREYITISGREFKNADQVEADMKTMHDMCVGLMNYVLVAWQKQHLDPHFEFEEDLFYGQVKAQSRRIKEEHERLRRKYVGDGKAAEVKIGRRNTPFVQACLRDYYDFRGHMLNIGQIISGHGGGVDEV